MSLSLIFMQLMSGMGMTCAIFFLTLLFSLPLGMGVALLRMGRNKVLSGIMRVNISILRGTPLMLQLFVVYYGPYYLLNIKLSPTYRSSAVYIGFIINYAAYFAEIYRSGIQSLPVGQYEAADILGYTRAQSFFRIILPQVVKRILPAVTNEVITLVKDTSLAFSISVMEMFTKAKALSSSQTSMTPLIVAGIFYYIFNFIVALMMERLEKKMDYYQ